MNVLVITQMFPCRRHPTSAIFFANLMNQLSARVNSLSIITPRIYFPKVLSKFNSGLHKWFLDEMHTRENGMEIFRPYVLSFPSAAAAGVNGILMQYSLRALVAELRKKRQLDLILGYNMLPEGIAAVRLANRLGLPGGFWAIGSDVNEVLAHNRLNYQLSKQSIAQSKLVLAESQDLENKLREFSNGSPKVRTFYKGIDVANFQNLPDKSVLREELKLNQERRYILFVGRLIRSKGVHELAGAFAKLGEKYPDVDLILLGEQTEKGLLVEKFAEAKILHRVLFKGIVPYGEVAKFMKASDLLAFPSHAEGLPNVVLEAMAVGLPVVASRVGGIPEVLKDGRTGLTVPPKDAGGLTLAMIKMLDDEDFRTSCVRRAKHLVLENFNVKNNVDILINHLTLLKNGNTT